MLVCKMLKDSTNGEPDDSIEKDIVKTLLQYDGCLGLLSSGDFGIFVLILRRNLVLMMLQ